jgi:hypothetical protein
VIQSKTNSLTDEAAVHAWSNKTHGLVRENKQLSSNCALHTAVRHLIHASTLATQMHHYDQAVARRRRLQLPVATTARDSQAVTVEKSCDSHTIIVLVEQH